MILSLQERGRTLLLGELYSRGLSREGITPPKALDEFCAFAARWGRHCSFFPPALPATVLPGLGIWDFHVEREVRFIQPAEETFKTQLLANVSFTRSLP